MTSPVDPFTLRDILTCPCGGLMLATTRIDTRFYTSGDGCRRRVDAIAVETEVWQRVSYLRPAVCDPALHSMGAALPFVGAGDEAPAALGEAFERAAGSPRIGAGSAGRAGPT
jgi:hypothetical protein